MFKTPPFKDSVNKAERISQQIVEEDNLIIEFAKHFPTYTFLKSECACSVWNNKDGEEEFKHFGTLSHDNPDDRAKLDNINSNPNIPKDCRPISKRLNEVYHAHQVPLKADTEVYDDTSCVDFGYTQKTRIRSK